MLDFPEKTLFGKRQGNMKTHNFRERALKCESCRYHGSIDFDSSRGICFKDFANITVYYEETLPCEVKDDRSGQINDNSGYSGSDRKLQ